MPIHSFFIQDDLILPVDAYTPNFGIEIYEVIRVINGVPLFIDDHLQRFTHSAWLLHLEIPLTGHEVSERLKSLIQANRIETGNIRFSWCFRPCGRFQAYFIPHHYPDAELVTKGVSCGLLHAERYDPNVKAVQANLREMADKLIREEGWYEVILVKEGGLITEGSRSNLFFVKGNELITAPDEDILPGITRKKVIEIAGRKGIAVTYRMVNESELPSMQAVFITGTSPKVLPILSIGKLEFKPALPVVRELVDAYDQEIEAFIRESQA
ncbi:MAG TPA: aminotransferase class IV [Prolixibacteraceae bacterium]|nr:aminotransferase class IV [Prolixibacteraceae bacterium]